MVLEGPVVKERLVWRTKDLNALDYSRLMIEVGTDLLEFLNFVFAVHLLVLVPFGLVFSFVVLPIQHEIVVASYHYLVLVREAFKKIPEAIHLPTIGVLREIASMNEDVSWWQAVDVDTIVTIVGVRHSYDSNHFR